MRIGDGYIGDQLLWCRGGRWAGKMMSIWANGGQHGETYIGQPYAMLGRAECDEIQPWWDVVGDLALTSMVMRRRVSSWCYQSNPDSDSSHDEVRLHSR